MRNGVKLWGVRAATAVLLLGPMAAGHAYAAGGGGGVDPTTILQNVATFIEGPFGQALAILGIIGVGAAFIFGRLALGLLVGVIGGICLIFGLGILIGAIIVAVCWGAHNNRMAEAARARTEELEAVRDQAETDPGRAATVRLEESK